MKEFKWVKLKDPLTGEDYYDILNEFETDPMEIVRSKLLIRLGTFKGEWGEDPDFGIPFLLIKNNSTSPDIIAQLISDEIFKVQYVIGVKITTKDYDENKRIFTASYDVVTDFGTTNIEVSV